MRRAVLFFMLGAVSITACSDDSGGGPPPSDSVSSSAVEPAITDGASTAATDAAEPSSTPPTTAAPTTTVAPVPLVPAGMQYDSEPVSVPATVGALEALADGSGWFALGTADSTVARCPGGTPGPCTAFAGNPVFYRGTSPDALVPSPIDDVATLPLPAGYSQPTYLYAADVAHGASGFVAVGSAAIWDSNLFHAAVVRPQIWQSADGVAWQRIAVPAGLGDRLGELIAVTATDAGFVAVGHSAAGDDVSAGPSRGVVLTSPDGVTWTATSELSRPWAVELQHVEAASGLLLAWGVEYACDATASAMIDFSVGGQTAVWASTDGGVTWVEVDLSALGLAGDRPGASTDPAACGDLTERSELAWSLGGVLEADGTFAIVSADGGTIAVSTDLATWAATSVPGGAPTAIDGVDLEPGARLMYTEPDGLVLLSAEPRRDADGYQLPFGTSVLGWRSGDRGATWEAIDATRPLAVVGTAVLARFADGSVALAVDDRDAAAGPTRTVWFSTAGELDEWATCDPAPGANCAFSALPDDADLDGADLTGIDLTGADMVDAVFDGATLDGARLDFAMVYDASFVGTSLSGASLRGAALNNAILTDAIISGADFTEARLPGNLLANPGITTAVLFGATVYLTADPAAAPLVLAGADLREVSLSGPSEGLGDLRGASFAGANLAGAFFSQLDLTGADFAGAIFSDDTSGSALFSGGNVCPDGAPTTPDLYDQAACRL